MPAPAALASSNGVREMLTAALTGSAIVGAITLAAPSALAPLNKGWFYVGETMGKIVTPVVLGVVFFGLLTPTPQ